jgi:hypothetical protein
MTVRALNAEEVEALLSDLNTRSNCTNGCECIFCRTFEDGVQSGKRDAEIHFKRALEQFAKKVSQ